MSSKIDLSKFSKKITVTGSAACRELQEDAAYPERIPSVEFQGSVAMQVSDGYHTMDELYNHRITLYIALCKSVRLEKDVWRSKKHSDGELCFGTGMQFVLGIGIVSGEQITYHIPSERWDECDFADTRRMAPEWDKHTSADVLERLKNL
jgi:hypothetical protein